MAQDQIEVFAASPTTSIVAVDTVPYYISAADIHNVANGKPSIIDNTNDSTLDHLTKGSLSVMARAITSTANIIPAATNWLGLTDIKEWQTQDLLAEFDDDLALYYSRNRDTIDVVGDMAASFIPGMAGVKALNYAQLGLKGLSRGNAGKNLLQSIGALPDATSKFATAGIAKMKDLGTTFNMIDSNALKAFASAYGQNALEMAAFETAAATAMKDFSPMFKDHTASDILYNSALGGGIIGGGILGTLSAAKTFGAFREARAVVDKALNPLRHIKDVPEGVDDFAKLLNYKAQFDNPPVFDAASGITESLAARTLEKRSRELGLSMQETATRMAGGDAEIGKILVDSMQAMPQDAAWAAVLHLKEVGRGASITTMETKLQAAAVARATLKQAEAEGTVLSKSQMKKLTEDAAFAESHTIKYLYTRGEQVGQVIASEPLALGIADRYAKSDLDAIVRKTVGKEAVPGIEWNPALKSIEQVEARYIVAAKQDLQEGVRIAGTDLPYLEAAYNKGLNSVVVDGVTLDNTQLLSHIKATKEQLALELIADTAIDPALNTGVIAKKLNVSESLIEGGSVAADGSSYFAVKSGLELQQPSVIKLAYNGSKDVGVSGDVLSGMATIKQLQETAVANNLKVATSILGEDTIATLPRIADTDVLAATSAGAGAGIFSFAAGNYAGLASKVEWIGKVTNRLKVQKQAEINELMQPLMYKILQNQDAGLEVATIRQKLLSTGDQYVLREGELVNKKLAAYEARVAKGDKSPMPPELAKLREPRIPLQHAETEEFLQAWVKYNDEFLSRERNLKNAIGKDTGNYGGVVYFPQPDTRKFKFFSMVVPKNTAMEGEKVSMLWANSAEELANLESKVPQQYSVLRKSDTERYYKAVKQYDYELGFGAGQMDADLVRSGRAAPFFAKSDPQQILQEMLDWRHRMSDKQVRDAVTLHNQVAFSELRRLDSEYIALQKSTKGTAQVDSPFSSYVQTALDIPRSAHVPVWTEFNNLAENLYSKVLSKAKDTLSGIKSPEELDKVNKVFDEAGVRGYKDALTELWANHPAGGRELSKHVMAANSWMSTLILRTDPMNALNNGVGSLVLTGSETSHLIKMIQKGGGTEAEQLIAKAFVNVPGSDKQALSSIKLISNAYTDWFKLLRKDPEMLALEAKFDKAGFLPTMMDQIRQTMDHATLTGAEKAGDISSKVSGLMKGTGELLEKVTGNKFAEEMNRFVAAHIADSLSSMAVRQGSMTAAEQYAFVNSFVNRTQGNYLASQRPLMFQGPVGHAISLFQTYSFNMMQHIFRHASNGDKRQLATLMGLQSSIYGLNGLPAFDFMNRTLVGTAAGNTTNGDLYSFMQNAGGDVGNWLLYGSLSTATGLGLYSRGDMNPRHMTILPTNPADVPFISATRKVLGTMVQGFGEVQAGADLGSTFLRSIEHAGLSRPLAGLATTMQGLGNAEEQGYSTTGKNGFMMAWDMYSLQSVGRILGAKPLDEAIARDAYHRVQVYDAHRQAQTAELGSAIRDKVRAGNDVTEEDVNLFLTEYLKRGGDQKNFIKFWQRNVKEANTSKVNKLIDNAKNPYSQYVQTMLHGGRLTDLNSESNSQGE